MTAYMFVYIYINILSVSYRDWRRCVEMSWWMYGVQVPRCLLPVRRGRGCPMPDMASSSWLQQPRRRAWLGPAPKMAAPQRQEMAKWCTAEWGKTCEHWVKEGRRCSIRDSSSACGEPTLRLVDHVGLQPIGGHVLQEGKSVRGKERAIEWVSGSQQQSNHHSTWPWKSKCWSERKACTSAEIIFFFYTDGRKIL